jgi:hypothetical protein
MLAWFCCKGELHAKAEVSLAMGNFVFAMPILIVRDGLIHNPRLRMGAEYQAKYQQVDVLNLLDVNSRFKVRLRAGG